MGMKIVQIVALLISSAIGIAGCSSGDKKNADQKEMLIYCGITMVTPMKELAARFEKTNGCKITITQGGSEDLYSSLAYSKVGELYLPGSQTYRKQHMEDGFLGEYVEIGYNQAALIVKKGNPKNLQADVRLLTENNLATVIGNPESCSIGRQSEKILTKQGIFDDVVNNVILIAADSRTMNKTIIDNSADLILNWGATAFFDENKEYMDRLALPESIAPKKKLQLSLLSFARDPDLARKFMLYAASVEGQEIFHKYGFLDTVSSAGEIQQ